MSNGVNVQSVEKSKTPETVREIFQNLSYGPAPEADNVAQVSLSHQLTLHSFFSTYLLPLILSIIPSFLLVFKIGSVLMVCLLIGSHLISHFALRLSQSMIPSLHSLLFPVVYPKVPYLVHSFSLSIQLLLAR